MPDELTARVMQVMAKTQHLPPESITIDNAITLFRFLATDDCWSSQPMNASHPSSVSSRSELARAAADVPKGGASIHKRADGPRQNIKFYQRRELPRVCHGGPEDSRWSPSEARASVLDTNDRLGVQVPYRASWRQL
jgi:hypothetical protein